MDHMPKEWWKHTTAPSAFGKTVGVDLFDDDDPGFVSIYIRFADGTRWPARTVDMSLPEHAESVLAACGEVHDYTNKPTGASP